MVIGLYVNGTSLVHRLSAKVKLSALFFCATVLSIVSSWWVQVGFLILTLWLWQSSRLGFSRIKKTGHMVIVFVLMAVVINSYMSSWEQGIVIGVRIITLMLLSMMVTYTTTLDEMSAVVSHLLSPLKCFGMNPVVIGFIVSFCLRLIPMIVAVVEDIREAQIARGQKISLLSLSVPLMIRLLSISSAMAESLDARGFDFNTSSQHHKPQA